MSTTPRTDEQVLAYRTEDGSEMVHASFAAKLETELITACRILNDETNRAEKAEAQLHALILICGTSDANKFQSWVDRERARAEKAEAELAPYKDTSRGIGGYIDSLVHAELDAKSSLAAEREKVRVLREALERRHTEQGYHRQYVDDVLEATKEASQ